MPVCGGLGFIHSFETRGTILMQSRVDTQPPMSVLSRSYPLRKAERGSK